MRGSIAPQYSSLAYGTALSSLFLNESCNRQYVVFQKLPATNIPVFHKLQSFIASSFTLIKETKLGEICNASYLFIKISVITREEIWSHKSGVESSYY